ncbi:hypothetical protein GCM10009809_25350 [Isoptericola hypogeus]|uniref:Uncharacterized protein n=1 Tax=Isoptericola hypogeus TaxID=300179 RepID=A0ABP4VJ49_9MICO
MSADPDVTAVSVDGHRGPWSRAAAVTARTCGWACAILFAVIPVVAVVAGIVAMSGRGDPGHDSLSAAYVCFVAWVVIVVVLWVLGWPVGLVVERLLARRGVAPGARAAVLAGVGGLLAVVASAALGLSEAPGVVAVLAVIGVVGAGGGRLAVIARDRPPVSEGRGTVAG